MPFTLVHPVAVVPLARGPLSLLALVSGSLAPDLPYFLRATSIPVTAESWYEPYVNATASHTPAELVSVTLPLALIVFACGLLVIPPVRWVAGIAPPRAATRGPRSILRRTGWVALSLVLGILTHLAWDALTEGGAASRVLQHASTVLGLVVLLVIAWRRRDAVAWGDRCVRRRILAVTVACTLAAVAGAALASRTWLTPSDELSTGLVVEAALTAATKGGVAGAVAMSALLTLLWWAARAGRGRARETSGETG